MRGKKYPSYGNRYEIMWVYLMFDLPVTTKKHRKIYADFRKKLLQSGFQMVQYSVYHRYCASHDQVDVIRRRINSFVPEEGMVSLMVITDKQFGEIKHFVRGKKPPKRLYGEQLYFF
jgi:CRISPR-associated protein Cas2